MRFGARVRRWQPTFTPQHNRTNTTATKPGHLDQTKARCFEQRAVQVSQWRADQRSYVNEEAHYERSGEKENCSCPAGEMGEGEAQLIITSMSQPHQISNAISQTVALKNPARERSGQFSTGSRVPIYMILPLEGCPTSSVSPLLGCYLDRLFLSQLQRFQPRRQRRNL
jgi:hypothetical protein